MLYYSPPDVGHIRYDEGFSARGIALPIPGANVAEIRLTGDYPEVGYVYNIESDMIVYVLEGEVIIETEKESFVLSQGATVFVPKNEPYCWLTDFVRMLVFSTPPWTPEQQRTLVV